MSDNPSESTPGRLDPLNAEHQKVRWDPTVNTGHLLTMAASMVSSLVFVMASWATMDKRVAVLEEARPIQTQVARDRQDLVNEKFADVKTSLNEIKASVEAVRREVSEAKKK